MIFWIKRTAAILGISTFFVLLVLGIASSHTVSWESFAPACARACAGGALLWIVGIIIADILFKGIITDIDLDQKNIVDGGLLQQVHSIKERTVPGGPELPFTALTPIKKKVIEKKT